MKIYLILAMAALAGIFVLQNTEVVEIRFLLWRVSLSRVLMLAGAIALGFVMGALTALEITRKKKASGTGHE